MSEKGVELSLANFRGRHWMDNLTAAAAYWNEAGCSVCVTFVYNVSPAHATGSIA